MKAKKGKKRISCSGEAPEFFCYHWEHLRRNENYQRFYRDASRGPEGEDSDAWESMRIFGLELARLKVLIDPTLSPLDAWKVAGQPKELPHIRHTGFRRIDVTDPLDPEFGPVQWNHSPSRSATWSEADRIRYQDLMRANAPDAVKRQFWSQTSIVDFVVNIRLPVDTLCREFRKELKEIEVLRSSVGAERSPLERGKRKWKKYLEIWDRVRKEVPKGKPKFRGLFERLYKRKIQDIYRKYPNHKKDLATFSSEIRDSFDEAERRIQASFPKLEC